MKPRDTEELLKEVERDHQKVVDDLYDAGYMYSVKKLTTQLGTFERYGGGRHKMFDEYSDILLHVSSGQDYLKCVLLYGHVGSGCKTVHLSMNDSDYSIEVDPKEYFRKDK